MGPRESPSTTFTAYRKFPNALNLAVAKIRNPVSRIERGWGILNMDCLDLRGVNGAKMLNLAERLRTSAKLIK